MEPIRGLHRLDLTEEQRELIRDILQAGRDACEAGREAVANATKALHTAVTEGADEAIIREAATNLGTALGDQAVLRASTITLVKEILTEEQLEQLQQMKAPKLRERLGGAGTWGGGSGRGRFPCPLGRGPGGPGRGPGMGPGAGLGIDRLIDNVDTDGDGTLTAEELEAFKENMKGRPGR
jgi:Spy/CpxP family protein refolding chaperone